MAAVSRGEELLRRQFEQGSLSPPEDVELQALLRASPELRSRYAKWVELERSLEGREVPRAQVERMLARGVPAARDPARPSNVVRIRRTWAMGGLTAAAAAAAVVVFAVSRPDPQIGVRGPSRPQSRPAWISVFQPMLPDSPQANAGAEMVALLRPVAEEAQADRPFAFAYTNLASSPYTHLAIVGRDAAGRVHWFHPAYTDPDNPPRSPAIDSGRVDVELAELVYVNVAPGPIEICGLFTETPLDVGAWDARLEAGESWPEPEGADCRTVQVTDTPTKAARPKPPPP